MNIKIKSLLIFIISLLLFNCSEYERMLKSMDSEAKYNYSVKLYDKKKYNKAIELFISVIKSESRVSQKGIESYWYLANCYYNEKNYFDASYYFTQFAKYYPNDSRVPDAKFYSAKCEYKKSDSYALDQSSTYDAIEYLQNFLSNYPDSDKKMEAEALMMELREKLEKKHFEQAIQYYDLEDYSSSSIALRNLLKQYPDTKNKEYIMNLIVKSDYYLYFNSVEAKKIERNKKFIESYNKFIDLYPKSKYISKLENLYNKSY